MVRSLHVFRRKCAFMPLVAVALPMPFSLLVCCTFGYELRVAWTSIVAVRTASFMSVARL
jgi:hypothetical protein